MGRKFRVDRGEDKLKVPISNQYKRILLFTVMALLVLWVGLLVGGWLGLGIVLGIAILIRLKTQDWTSALLLYLHDAKELEESHDPELFRITKQLAQCADLPLPRLYVMAEEAPNIFAVGRTPYHAAIVLTEGLRHVLNRDEQAAVIAHELAHIKSGDTPLMSVVAILASALYLAHKVFLPGWIGYGEMDRPEVVSSSFPGLLEAVVWCLTIPMAVILTQVILDSCKEVEADAVGAGLTGEPLALASALHKMEAALARTSMRVATPATAHLFIMNPYWHYRRRWLVNSHPATGARIASLEELERQRHDPGFAA